ncbi:MAG: dihydroorotate dehydrogenase electron transfer subunit [Lactobacillales bacterium]|jgi:dihydroorotate dehydrogenase electron transfer subunit|nr:dihydroorotate dehydrogenase electron transfer subunit [Lactobacillales bacterium]
MKLELMTITRHELIAHKIYAMTLRGELVKEMKEPGQFIHIKVPRADLGLRRPISISSISPETNECVIIYRVEGDGTRVLAELPVGSEVDVMGPLGTGFDMSVVEEGETAFLIGGGIGVPPLYEVARQLHAKGVKVYAFLGFATEDAIILEDEFKQYAELLISTDDGTYGFKGNSIDLMNTIRVEVEPDAVYSCGAPGMLRAVDTIFKDHKAAYVSLEARMACGMGACYACVCHVQGDETNELSKKVCDEGPVFKTGEVIF